MPNGQREPPAPTYLSDITTPQTQLKRKIADTTRVEGAVGSTPCWAA